MNQQELDNLYSRMLQIHNKVDEVFQEARLPGMLKNEYNNKINQYESMYSSVEMMKSIAKTKEAVDGLIDQQTEILNVRMKCELDLAKRAATYL